MIDRYRVGRLAFIALTIANAKLFHFIEIGTSNFETVIEAYHSVDMIRGLSVEPLNHLLQQLPRGKNAHLVNAAISDYDGMGTMYYTKQEYKTNFMKKLHFLFFSEMREKICTTTIKNQILCQNWKKMQTPTLPKFDISIFSNWN